MSIRRLGRYRPFACHCDAQRVGGKAATAGSRSGRPALATEGSLKNSYLPGAATPGCNFQETTAWCGWAPGLFKNARINLVATRWRTWKLENYGFVPVLQSDFSAFYPTQCPSKVGFSHFQADRLLCCLIQKDSDPFVMSCDRTHKSNGRSICK